LLCDENLPHLLLQVQCHSLNITHARHPVGACHLRARVTSEASKELIIVRLFPLPTCSLVTLSHHLATPVLPTFRSLTSTIQVGRQESRTLKSCCPLTVKYTAVASKFKSPSKFRRHHYEPISPRLCGISIVLPLTGSSLVASLCELLQIRKNVGKKQSTH
jgi:hypothetical protein